MGAQAPGPVDLCSHEVLLSGRGRVSPRLACVWFPRLGFPLSALLTVLLQDGTGRTLHGSFSFLPTSFCFGDPLTSCAGREVW